MVGGLGGLLELRLSDNKLTALPREIGLLRALRVLVADNNMLAALPGQARSFLLFTIGTPLQPQYRRRKQRTQAFMPCPLKYQRLHTHILQLAECPPRCYFVMVCEDELFCSTTQQTDGSLCVPHDSQLVQLIVA